MILLFAKQYKNDNTAFHWCSAVSDGLALLQGFVSGRLNIKQKGAVWKTWYWRTWLGEREMQAVFMILVTRKEWKRKNSTWCSVFHWRKARNSARPPDTTELRWKAVLSVLDPTFACFQLDCPQTDIACWSSVCWLNQLEQFLVSFTRKHVSTLGLLQMVNYYYNG